jgi:hypothetical protein
MFTVLKMKLASEVSALVPAAIIYIFGSFGAILLSSTHMYLIEQALCRRHYIIYEPARIRLNGLVNEESCKLPDVETRVASIYGIYCSLWYLPSQHASIIRSWNLAHKFEAFFLAGSYGKIKLLVGKRTVMLLNLFGLTLAGIYFTSICKASKPQC